MQSGRLDYAYRLSAARLAILSLRFTRRWKRLFRSPSSLARTIVFHGLMGMAVLIAVAGSAWIGYRSGQQTEVDAMVQAVPVITVATRQVDGRKTPAALAAERSTVPASVAASTPLILAVTESKRVDRQAQSARLVELASLRKAVDELQALVQALEQETTGLEVELLDQQIAFAKVEERWREAPVERRIVYNITNIPVGGSVTEERIESDAEQTGFPAPESDFNDQAEGVDNDTDPYLHGREIDPPVERWDGDTYLADVPEQHSIDGNIQSIDQVERILDRTAGGRVGRYSARELSVPTGLPAENPSRQEVFFGPAEDLPYEWNNP